jgi:hypothetical protein
MTTVISDSDDESYLTVGVAETIDCPRKMQNRDRGKEQGKRILRHPRSAALQNDSAIMS